MKKMGQRPDASKTQFSAHSAAGSTTPAATPPAVAFIDSGIGGIPYLRHFLAEHPHIPTRYIADSRHFPYGLRSQASLCRILEELVQNEVLPYGISIVAIVCNTASVAGLEYLRGRFPEIHFVGTVPAIKPAAERTKTGHIGILATERTIGDPYLDKLIHSWAPGVAVHRRALPRLVEFVEARKLDKTEEFEQIVADVVSDFRSAAVDTVVLACTHFLYVARRLAAAFGGSTEVIDSRSGVSKQIFRVFEQVISTHSPSGPARLSQSLNGFAAVPVHSRVCTLGDPSAYFEGLDALWGEPAGSLG